MKEKWEKIGEVSGPDAKNRIILTPALKQQQSIDGFTVFANQVGEIKLVPVIKIPAYEAWLYNNPKALKQVEEGMKDALEGRVGPLSRKRLKKSK